MRLFDEYSDLHKELYGVRPRFSTMPPVEWLQEQLALLEEEMRDERNYQELREQDAAEEPQNPCVDCGDPNAFDDWECREGIWRCCDCNAATFKGVRVPREWLIDG